MGIVSDVPLSRTRPALIFIICTVSARKNTQALHPVAANEYLPFRSLNLILMSRCNNYSNILWRPYIPGYCRCLRIKIRLTSIAHELTIIITYIRRGNENSEIEMHRFAVQRMCRMH